MLDMKQEISTEIKQELVKQALAARKFAYVPYSKFRVGAAVLAKNGAIYTGCNIENAAYTPTNCAERPAVFKAVSEGITEFDAIAVCGGPGEAEPGDFCTPCGVCRQVLREFVDPNEFLVLLCKGDGSEESWSYQLNAAEQDVLLRKMEEYCQQQTGMSLHDYAQQFREEPEQQHFVSGLPAFRKAQIPGIVQHIECDPEHFACLRVE